MRCFYRSHISTDLQSISASSTEQQQRLQQQHICTRVSAHAQLYVTAHYRESGGVRGNKRRRRRIGANDLLQQVYRKKEMKKERQRNG